MSDTLPPSKEVGCGARFIYTAASTSGVAWAVLVEEDSVLMTLEVS